MTMDKLLMIKDSVGNTVGRVARYVLELDADVRDLFVWEYKGDTDDSEYVVVNNLDCRYTCHSKCISGVRLECPKAPTAEKSLEELTKETLEILNETNSPISPIRRNNNLPKFVSSIQELRTLIDEYNQKSSLIMTLHPDCTFDGFIRVHMNLNRPVNVNSDVSNLTMKRAVARTRARNRQSMCASRRPLSEVFQTTHVDTCDSGLGSSIESSSTSGSRSSTSSATLSPTSLTVHESFQFTRKNARRLSRKLSFYMPKGTFKPLHVTSSTTAKEVIEALLQKYNVTDNPRKFALYETTKREGSKEMIYRKVGREEKPLVICLSWGANTTSRSFALREDEDGNVQWSAFELPELNNFLKILQLEEDESLAQIYQKYENYRDALQRALESKATRIEYPDSNC